MAFKPFAGIEREKQRRRSEVLVPDRPGPDRRERDQVRRSAWKPTTGGR